MLLITISNTNIAKLVDDRNGLTADQFEGTVLSASIEAVYDFLNGYTTLLDIDSEEKLHRGEKSRLIEECHKQIATWRATGCTEPLSMGYSLLDKKKRTLYVNIRISTVAIYNS